MAKNWPNMAAILRGDSRLTAIRKWRDKTQLGLRFGRHSSHALISLIRAGYALPQPAEESP